MSSNRFHSLILLALLFCSNTVYGRAYLSSTHLTISLDQGEADLDDSDKESVLKGCDLLGSSLSLGKGLFGFGFFDKFKCRFLDEDEEDSRNQQKSKKPAPTPFTLSIKLGPKTKFILSQKSIKDNTLFEDQLEIKDSFVETFSNKKILDLIAFKISLSLPAQLKLKNKKNLFQNEFIHAKPVSQDLELSPPKKLILYKLHHRSTNGYWGVKISSQAKLSDEKLGKKKIYKIEERIDVGLLDENYYAGIHPDESEWKQAALKKVDEAIKEETFKLLSFVNRLTSTVINLLGKNVAAGFVGIRYGAPMLKGGVLIEDLQYLGAFAEFRTGLLKGSRFSYDSYLTQTKLLGDKEAKLGGQNLNLGWTYRDSLPGYTALLFDAGLNLGVWEFELDYPITTAKNEQGNDIFTLKSFKLENAPSLGLEFGIEYAIPSMLLRLWTKQNIGQSLDAISQGSIASREYGLDSQMVSFDLVGIRVSTVLFGFYEDVVLKQNVEKTTDIENLQIDRLNLIQIYLGAGVSLLW